MNKKEVKIPKPDIKMKEATPMGLPNPMDLLWGKGKSTIPASIKKEKMYTLTNLGREQVEELQGDEQDFGVLATMSKRRAWSLDDLSHELKMPTNKVYHELQRHMGQGFVKTIGADGDR